LCSLCFIMASMVDGNEDLIFDVGFHRGEDTAFYLAKGFRVIAIEASPTLVADAKEKFRDSISEGRLTIVNVAIAEMPGPIDFFANPTSEWGTIRKEWANRNANLGSASSHVLTVTGVNFCSIIEQYGTPYYLKVDIEGADLLCLEALKKPEVPKYVSIESDMVSWQSLEHEFEVLTGLGYRRFKVVPQHQVHRQHPPRPQREGLYVPYHFHHMCSGMFGEEAPGRWLSASQALLQYRRIFLRYRLYGHNGRYRDTPTGKALRLILGQAGWYDTHAAL
jgi:FkbM family methyltransferase